MSMLQEGSLITARPRWEFQWIRGFAIGGQFHPSHFELYLGFIHVLRRGAVARRLP